MGTLWALVMIDSLHTVEPTHSHICQSTIPIKWHSDHVVPKNSSWSVSYVWLEATLNLQCLFFLFFFMVRVFGWNLKDMMKKKWNSFYKDKIWQSLKSLNKTAQWILLPKAFVPFLWCLPARPVFSVLLEMGLFFGPCKITGYDKWQGASVVALLALQYNLAMLTN